jgi:hypothetical protein
MAPPDRRKRRVTPDRYRAGDPGADGAARCACWRWPAGWRRRCRRPAARISIRTIAHAITTASAIPATDRQKRRRAYHGGAAPAPRAATSDGFGFRGASSMMRLIAHLTGRASPRYQRFRRAAHKSASLKRAARL